jgi:hypothetical protein
VEKNNQATNINVGTIINTRKSRKQREKERENTRSLFTHKTPSSIDTPCWLHL